MTEKIITLDGQEIAVTLTRQGDAHRVNWAERADSVEILALREREAELRINGRRVVVPFVRDGSSVSFLFDGETYRAELRAPGQKTRGRHREHSMSAPMPGLVLKISVGVGDVVTRGMPLLILEAMKMEHQLHAPYDGVVSAIRCSAGETVHPGFDLIEITPHENQP
jgi:3-methylcrotonyl-CoA carboxylase alpha subunit